MRIIKFVAKWCHKCKLFSKTPCDLEVDIDLPSYAKTLVKYQVSIVPTFVALDDRGRVIGKLSNPMDIEAVENWRSKLGKKGK